MARETMTDWRERTLDRVGHGLAALDPVGGGRPAPYPKRAPRDSEIVIGCLDDARALAHSFDAVLTIESPGSTPETGRFARLSGPGAPAHKILRFYDVEDPWQAAPPMRHHVRAALAFARRHAAGRLLIHCFAGVSRSTALAFAILVHRHDAVGREYGMLERVVAMRPQACPNRLIVRHADALLGCDGRMIEAVEAYPAIAETRRRNFSPPPLAEAEA